MENKLPVLEKILFVVTSLTIGALLILGIHYGPYPNSIPFPNNIQFWIKITALMYMLLIFTSILKNGLIHVKTVGSGMLLAVWFFTIVFIAIWNHRGMSLQLNFIFGGIVAILLIGTFISSFYLFFKASQTIKKGRMVEI